MKTVTSVTIFRDGVGMRMSMTYSVINEETGQIEEDNKRASRIITDASALEDANNLIGYAQEFVDTL